MSELGVCFHISCTQPILLCPHLTPLIPTVYWTLCLSHPRRWRQFCPASILHRRCAEMASLPMFPNPAQLILLRHLHSSTHPLLATHCLPRSQLRKVHKQILSTPDQYAYFQLLAKPWNPSAVLISSLCYFETACSLMIILKCVPINQLWICCCFSLSNGQRP